MLLPFCLIHKFSKLCVCYGGQASSVLTWLAGGKLKVSGFLSFLKLKHGRKIIL